MDLSLTSDELALLDEIRTHLANFSEQRRELIPLLQFVQEKLGYIPSQAIGLIAEKLNLSYSQVYGVATFYNQFRFTPPGKYPIKVCVGTTCHVKNADIILEHFERKLDIREGETTPDREYSLERVPCVGCCALAPVAMVGKDVQGHMAPSKVEGVLTRIRIEKEIEKRKMDQK